MVNHVTRMHYFLLFFIGTYAQHITASTTPSITSAVLKRYYLIQRLDKVIAITTAKKTFDQELLLEVADLVKHPRIRTCITALADSGDTAPLVQLWKRLKAYRWLEDEFLTEELVRIVYFLTYTHTKDNNLLRHSSKEISAEDIAYRFYLIHRLRQAINCCIQKKAHEPLIDLLQQTWQDFQHYKAVGDAAYTRQLCCLIISIVEPKALIDTQPLAQLLVTIDSLVDGN